MEYIERDIAAEIIKKLAFSQCSPFDKQEAIDGIESVPAADVEEVRHGEWLEGNRWQPCSKCHKRGKRSWKYCPKCGARMDGKEKNDD